MSAGSNVGQSAPTPNSRRAFLKRLATMGAIVAAGSVAGLGFYSSTKAQSALNSSISASSASEAERPGQKLQDASTGDFLNTTLISENQSVNFTYPLSQNPESNSNSFSAFLLIHLPKGFTVPGNLGAIDPISGDTFIAFSRVCVHLWCLCSFDPTQELIVCPCHGSSFVPGNGAPYNQPPGTAVAGPASEQPSPNNTLPIVNLDIYPDGSIYATGLYGQVGCGQLCGMNASTTTT